MILFDAAGTDDAEDGDDADVYAHVKAAGERYTDPQYDQESAREKVTT